MLGWAPVSSPAQVPHRGLGIGDAGVELHRPIGDDHAPDLALLQSHRLRVDGGPALIGGHGFGGRPGEKEDQQKNGHIARVAQELQIPLAPLEGLEKQQGEGRRGDDEQGKAPQGVFVQLQHGRHQQEQQPGHDPESDHR